MPGQNKVIWDVIRTLVEKRSELERRRAVELAALRDTVAGLNRMSHCGGRGCHTLALAARQK